VTRLTSWRSGALSRGQRQRSVVAEPR